MKLTAYEIYNRRKELIALLNRCNCDIKKTAEEMDCGTANLYKLIKSYKINFKQNKTAY